MAADGGVTRRATAAPAVTAADQEMREHERALPEVPALRLGEQERAVARSAEREERERYRQDAERRRRAR